MNHKPPEEGDIQILEKYLYFPLRLEHCIKWLVIAIIEYKYISGKWKAIRFLIDDEV